MPTIVVGTYTPGAIGGKWNSGYGQGTDPRAWPYEFGEPRGSVRLSLGAGKNPPVLQGNMPVWIVYYFTGSMNNGEVLDHGNNWMTPKHGEERLSFR